MPDGRLLVVEAGTGKEVTDPLLASGRVSLLDNLNGDGDFDDENERVEVVSRLPSYNGLTMFGTGSDEVGGAGDIVLIEDGSVFFTKDDPRVGYLDERLQSAFDIAQGAAVLATTILNSDAGPRGGPPRLLLLAPPPLATVTDFAELFEGAEATSRGFSAHYRRVADELGCAYLDTAEVVASSPIDGIHLELGEHRKLGLAVAARAREILGI